MKRKILLPAVLSTLVIGGCATGYTPINPKDMDLPQSQAASGPVQIASRHDVLGTSGNYRYDVKANQHRMDVMAVSIKNTSDRPINTRDDLEFTMDGMPVVPEKAGKVPLYVRQRTGAYFLYLLMSPIVLIKSEVKCENFSCEEDRSVFPIGLILGLLLTGINAGRSSSANTAFEKELTENDLYGKTLQPGEKLKGILVFRDQGSGTLSARLRSDAAPAAVPATPAPDAAPANPLEEK